MRISTPVLLPARLAIRIHFTRALAEVLREMAQLRRRLMWRRINGITWYIHMMEQTPGYILMEILYQQGVGRTNICRQRMMYTLEKQTTRCIPSGLTA